MDYRKFKVLGEVLSECLANMAQSTDIKTFESFEAVLRKVIDNAVNDFKSELLIKVGNKDEDDGA